MCTDAVRASELWMPMSGEQTVAERREEAAFPVIRAVDDDSGSESRISGPIPLEWGRWVDSTSSERY